MQSCLLNVVAFGYVDSIVPKECDNPAEMTGLKQAGADCGEEMSLVSSPRLARRTAPADGLYHLVTPNADRKPTASFEMTN